MSQRRAAGGRLPACDVKAECNRKRPAAEAPTGLWLRDLELFDVPDPEPAP